MSRVRLSSKPGQPGTKSLVAQYGERLVCVRYRYDAQKRRRFKTVELIVDSRSGVPEADSRHTRFARSQIPPAAFTRWRRSNSRQSTRNETICSPSARLIKDWKG